MDFWENKEAELVQRQEEILLRREALLRGREAYYDSQDNRPSSFIVDYTKAMHRNERLMSDINSLSQKLGDETDHSKYKEFYTLKDNYWVMVRNTFPVWYDEQAEYENKYGSPRPAVYRSSPRQSNQSFNLSYQSARPSNQSPRLSGRSGNVNFPVPRSPRGSRASPVMSRSQPGGAQQRARQSQETPRQSHDTLGSQETLTVPPLELDYSQGDDLTTYSQTSALRPQTPKSALATGSSSKSKNKKVQIKDEKALKDQKKAEEKAAKLEKERLKKLKKQEEKEKKKSARTPKK